MHYITALKCITTHKKIREIGDALGKNDIFSHYVPILPPIPLKIRALPPYEIYVFGMSKTWATFRSKEIYKFV